jgi:hypothetical protein
MASDVDVCNMALSHLGSDAQVAAINPPDGSVEAGHCRRFFVLARQEALEMAPFTWTKKRALLAEVTNPSTVWRYAYALPSDCISPLRVLQATQPREGELWPSTATVTADDLALFSERGSAHFEIEGGVLLTMEAEAVLLYTRDIPDPGSWSPSFVSGLSYLLAGYLAGPIIKGEAGATAGQKFRMAARDALSSAAVMDANSSHETQEFVPASLAVR